jgi:peptidoglycan/LPS O-acetylase OafA/YrhL
VALNVGWSLVLEEWFYFTFPWFLYAVHRLSRGRLSAVSCVALVSVALLVGCGTLRCILQFNPSFPDPSFHGHPIMRLDCAAWGVLAACLYSLKSQFPAPSRAVWWLAMLAAWLVCFGHGALWVALQDPEWQRLLRFAKWQRFFLPFEWSIMNMAFALFVLLLAWSKAAGRGWLGYAITTISVLSYSIYLFHGPVVIFVRMTNYNAFGVPVGVAITLVAIICGAFVTYWLIEQPFLWLRDRLPFRHGVPARSAGASPMRGMAAPISVRVR